MKHDFVTVWVGLRLFIPRSSFFISFSFLFVQFPFGTVLAILDFKAQGGEFVANFVAGGPVLVGFGLGALFEQHVYHVPEGFFAGGVRGILGLQAQVLLFTVIYIPI